MAFYHPDGLPAAWRQATKFAGRTGRLATMPDIVTARLATAQSGGTPWETYFTTLTAEYFGFSRQKHPILIVAHGIGPMATLDGVHRAYSWQYKDRDRNRRGGRITNQEFWDLESGAFGEVSIVDIADYRQRYRYPFMETLRASQAATDPVLIARLGSQAEQYVQAHAAIARTWHREQSGLEPKNEHNFPEDRFRESLWRRRQQHVRDGGEDGDPYILTVEDPPNCGYLFGGGYREMDEGYALAHLVSTGRLCHLHHEGNQSLVLEVGCHEWWNGVRLVGIRAGSTIESVHPGADAHTLLRKHWRDLREPAMPVLEKLGFRGLVQFGEQWFTQYAKQGDGLDTGEPEYVVRMKEKVGEPVLFRTETKGYHGFFKFSVNDLRAIAPPQANAYHFVSEPQIEWNGGDPSHQTVMVQFYLVIVDANQRVIRVGELVHDFEKLMELVARG
jgi:hypothetical protein